MQKADLLRRINSGLLLVSASMVMVPNASATPAILGQAAGKGIDVSAGCEACHTDANASGSNVKAGYREAYDADKANLSGLVALINGPAPTPEPLPTPTPTPEPVPTPTPTPEPLPTPTPTPEPVPTPTPTPEPVPTPTPTPEPVPTPTPTPEPVPTPTPTPEPVPTPPMSCPDEDDLDDNDAGEHSRHKHHSKLKVSHPGKVAVHAGQTLRLGVVAYGDNRNITIGGNLPEGASFEETYNDVLRLRQGVMAWTVPDDESGNSKQIKFCAEAHGGTKSDTYSDSDISVEVLPKLASVTEPAPAVAESNISSAVINKTDHKLEVSGQVTWSPESTTEERTAAIESPISLSDAKDEKALGTAEIGLDGKWSVSINLPENELPHAIDAIFHGRVGTKLITKLKNTGTREEINP